jgi:capsid protein
MLKAIRKSLGRLLGYEAEKARLHKQLDAAQERAIRATYDAARTTPEYRNIWANADRYDADSAHSKDVRHTLIERSRYEIGSNGYSDGIAQTYATDLVGCGPQLRMQTGSQGFNQMVELTWHLWSKAIQFRRKLWCMAHAKHQDGEAFGVLRRNPGVKHPLPLDLCLYEAEQVQTPYVPFTEPGYIDGIKFDQFGNPVYYDILHEHPGTTHSMRIDLVPERVAAENVLHLFKLRRPGQHRAVPECSSTLNVGAASRRWRESVLAAAETAADFTLMMKTQQNPDGEDPVRPFTEMDINKRMMAFLPAGWDPFQLDAKFPTQTHESFHKTLVNEQARPKSMPYNKAACDSSSYNYASGRLDHQTYYGALDVDREDANDLVLDPLFDVWFDLAIVRFGWLGGNPEAVGPAALIHLWDWPKHRVADVESEANANQTRLQSGQAFLHTLYSDAGMDFEDELEKSATSFGISVDEMRKRLLDVLLPPAQKADAPPTKADMEEAVEAMVRNFTRRNGHANGAKVNGN